jgi:hypothetical protein
MTTSDRKNGGKTDHDRDGRLTKGNNGHPKGARHKATQGAEQLLEGEAGRLTRAAIDQALAGDPSALRLYLERLVPPRWEAPVSVDIPTIEDARDLLRAITTLFVGSRPGGRCYIEPVPALGSGVVVEPSDADRGLTALSS